MRTLATALVLGALVVAQDNGARVSVAVATAYAGPSDASQVLAHVAYGLEVAVQAVEGDWCRVSVPVGATRVSAYVRRFALTLSAGAAGTRASAPAPAADADASNVPDPRTKMFVAADVAGKTRWLLPSPVRAVPIESDGSSVRALVAGHAREIDVALAGLTAGPSPSATVSWLWAVWRDRAPVALDAADPVLTVIYNDVSGFDPNDYAPALVSLTRTSTSWRVLSLARGRMDAPAREVADWPLADLLKQDVVPSRVDLGAVGIMKIHLSAPLDPGEYAVVLRPRTREMRAGWRVFDESSEGRAFSVAWLFTIR